MNGSSRIVRAGEPADRDVDAMAEAIWDVCFAPGYSNPPRPFHDLGDGAQLQMRQHAANVMRRLAAIVSAPGYQLRPGVGS